MDVPDSTQDDFYRRTVRLVTEFGVKTGNYSQIVKYDSFLALFKHLNPGCRVPTAADIESFVESASLRECFICKSEEEDENSHLLEVTDSSIILALTVLGGILKIEEAERRIKNGCVRFCKQHLRTVQEATLRALGIPHPNQFDDVTVEKMTDFFTTFKRIKVCRDQFSNPKYGIMHLRAHLQEFFKAIFTQAVENTIEQKPTVAPTRAATKRAAPDEQLDVTKKVKEEEPDDFAVKTEVDDWEDPQ